MSSKILNHIKKVIIASAIIVLCGTNATYAFSLGGQNLGGSNNFLRDLINKLFNIEQNEYNLEDLQIDFEALKDMKNIDFSQIKDLINKLPAGKDKDILSFITKYSQNFEGMKGFDISALLGKLITAVKSLLGGTGDGLDLNLDLNIDLGGLLGGLLGGGSLEADITKTITMDAKTAVEFAGEDVAAKLSATMYMHEEKTDKWALLIHPFMLDGTAIAGSVGPYYYEKGYNIIAPDLRGFGNSEGSVALGCFESMDIYDWLVKLNAEYDVSQVIVHGISLGGATTNYLSGIDGFINNGPTKIKSTIKPIRQLKVVGLVEDCGYVDMTEFASKSIVMLFSGLEKDTFDYYSKATNSLKYCDIPMLIIHGTSDTTVDPENAETIKNTVKGDVDVWMVDGGAHAFIVMGSNADEYKEHVHAFIDKNGKDAEETVVSGGEGADAPATESQPADNNDKLNYFRDLLKKIFNRGK